MTLSVANLGFGWGGGGAEKFSQILQSSKVELGEQSEQILAGGQGCLRALEALAFLIDK